MKNKKFAVLLCLLFVLLPCRMVRAEQVSTEQVSISSEEVFTKEQADQVVRYIFEQIAAGALDSEETVREAIAQGEEEFQMVLSEEEKNSIVKLVNTVNSWDLDTDELLEKGKGLYEKYGTALLEKPEQILAENAKETVKAGAAGFFAGVGKFFAGVGTEVKVFLQNAAESFLELF